MKQHDQLDLIYKLSREARLIIAPGEEEGSTVIISDRRPDGKVLKVEIPIRAAPRGAIVDGLSLIWEKHAEIESKAAFGEDGRSDEDERQQED